jgi:cell filamentation protein
MRYVAEGAQSAFEPGSEDCVLANKLGITTQADMDDAELRLLQQLYESVFIPHTPTAGISVADLSAWHRQWLGPIYAWAGELRSVNLSKGNFHFAAAAQVPKLLQMLERDYLRKWTPCTALDDETLIEAIATIHVEFILIHPFREGNGRLSRLLVDVMAAQAGYGTLDYSAWDRDRDAYFMAINAGLGGNYEPMKRLVEAAFNAG